MAAKQRAHRHLPSLGEDLSPSHIRYLGVGLLASASSLAGVWLFLPATITRFGLIIIWIVTSSVLLRTIINLELARYTCLTGQAAPVGFAKLFLKPKHFAAIFLALGALQAATLAWAIPTGRVLAAAQLGRIPGTGDELLVRNWGYITFLLCVAILSIGPRITKTLKLVSGALIFATTLLLLWIDLSIVPPKTWGQGINGLISFGVAPPGLDLVAFAGLAAFFVGGLATASVSNWYRDEGVGIAGRLGYIPAIVRGSGAKLSDARYDCPPTDRNVKNFFTWWRLFRIDQWGLFCIVTLSVVLLWSLLVAVSSPAGNATYDAILAQAAQVVDKQLGLGQGTAIFLLAGITFWIFFSTQLVTCDVVARQVTDLAYAFPAFREWSRGDARRIYYFSLVLFVVWSASSINVNASGSLLTFGSGIGNLLLALVALLTLRLNLKLPRPFRPSRASQVGLLAGAIFFATMSIVLLSETKF